MGSSSKNSDGDAQSGDRLQPQMSQEDFDREFYGRILRRSDRNTDVVRRQAELLARHGEYSAALRLDRILTERLPQDPVAHYNMACSLSMNGECVPAVAALARAIDLGYRDFAHILADPDLDPLRDLSSFNELLRRRIPDDAPPRIV